MPPTPRPRCDTLSKVAYILYYLNRAKSLVFMEFLRFKVAAPHLRLLRNDTSQALLVVVGMGAGAGPHHGDSMHWRAPRRGDRAAQRGGPAVQPRRRPRTVKQARRPIDLDATIFGLARRIRAGSGSPRRAAPARPPNDTAVARGSPRCAGGAPYARLRRGGLMAAARRCHDDGRGGRRPSLDRDPTGRSHLRLVEKVALSVSITR